MGAEVLVLVTCTNRKTVPPAPALMLRAVPGRTPETRAEAWLKRLKSAQGDCIPAESLYSGDHWHVVRSIYADAIRAKQSVKVWVCSAGYGLIPFQARIASYAATFAPNHPDSVTRGVEDGQASEARRAWWSALASWRAPALGATRSIKDLVSEHINSHLIVAASSHYLDAISDDLAKAAALLGSERLAIFCAGSHTHTTLRANLVPCDARLQRALGGALNSLNVRCVRYALAHRARSGLELTGLRGLFSRLLHRQPEWEPPDRKPLSDEEIRAFIRKGLAENPRARPTPLLRSLRESGRACEQRRFGELFLRMEGGRHG